MKNILTRSGFHVTAVCTTGGQAINVLEELTYGILVCSYKYQDMMYSELHDYLPPGVQMLLMASKQVLSEVGLRDIMCLSMPLKINELLDTMEMMSQTIERKKKKDKEKPKIRNEEEKKFILDAKHLLMERNNMSEEDAHRYIQKCSMDNGTNMVETAQMILSIMHN